MGAGTALAAPGCAAWAIAASEAPTTAIRVIMAGDVTGRMKMKMKMKDVFPPVDSCGVDKENEPRWDLGG
jgi:hypothetical protein